VSDGGVFGGEQLVLVPGRGGTRRPGAGALGCIGGCERCVDVVDGRLRAVSGAGQRGFSVQPRGVDLAHEQKVTALYAPGLRAAAVGGLPGNAQQWGAQHRWLGQYV